MTAAVADLFDPNQFGNHDTLILDRTLIPVHDHAIAKPSKNYPRPVNLFVYGATQLTAATTRRAAASADEAHPFVLDAVR